MEQGEGSLSEAELIFFHLIEDEKLFNTVKFRRALVQQKARRVADTERKAGSQI